MNTNLKAIITLAIGIQFLMLSPATTADSSIEGTWVWTWTDIVFKSDGTTPVIRQNNLSTFTSDGHYCYMAMQDDRAIPDGAINEWTKENLVNTLNSVYGNCGTYELKDGKIIMNLNISVTPSMMGMQFIHKIKIDGNKMTMIADNELYSGVMISERKIEK